MHLAPIILFVYNRPEHTERTLKALENNLGAEQTVVYIYSDAAKNENAEALVMEVRDIIRRPWGFKQVNIIERDRNWGLAANVIDGVTKIVNTYGYVIVFEDDLESSPYALDYFNKALAYFQNEGRVMQISGYGYPVRNLSELPETFFFRVANSWGWATWARAWKYFNPDLDELVGDFSREQIDRFSIEGKENFWKQVGEFKSGKINSWAIRWYASVFRQNGLVLYPRNSMIQNIGNDGSGTHTAAEKTYEVVLANEPVNEFPKVIAENEQAYKAIKYFYAHRKGSLLTRGIRFMRKKYGELKK